MNKLVIIFIVHFFLFGEYNAGYPGANFNYGTNAKDIALSRSTLSIYNKGFNAFINPALLLFCEAILNLLASKGLNPATSIAN